MLVRGGVEERFREAYEACLRAMLRLWCVPAEGQQIKTFSITALGSVRYGRKLQSASHSTQKGVHSKTIGSARDVAGVAFCEKNGA